MFQFDLGQIGTLTPSPLFHQSGTPTPSLCTNSTPSLLCHTKKTGGYFSSLLA
ncbi:MAG: hypothetical protein FWE96_08295 [Coriobacteriia bacterium]|nr:hypothetical protein [Coriobacteriia bacterium]